MALEPETDGPAIRALGSLFKVTEVFLWDAAAVDMPEVSTVIIHDDSSTEEPVIMDACVKSCSKIEPIVDDFTASLEDMELTRHMNALGLPTSFSTNKERTVMSKKKRMAAQEKSNHAGHKDSKVGVSELTIGTRGEIVCSSNSFQSDTSRSMDDIMANDPNENSHYNVADGNSQPDLHGGEGYADSVKLCIDSGNWRSFWDDFYSRNYFYNIETHETTWCPPPGMEHLAFSDTADKSNGAVTDGVERYVDLCGACDDTEVHDSESQDKIENFHEVGNYDSVTSGVLCVQFMNIEKLDSNISCFDGYQINKCSSPPDTSKNLDELEGNAACIQVKEICDEDLCPAPFDSSSLTQNDIDRMILTTMYLILLLNFNRCLQSMRNQLGSEDVSRSDLQLTSMNSKADEVDNCGHLDELEGDITCHEANKISDEILQVPSSNRLGTIAAAAVYEELGGSGLQQEYLNPTIDELDGHQNGTSSKKKTKVKRAQAERKMLSNDREEISLSKMVPITSQKKKKRMVAGLSADTHKYWWQRYLLFSRFDEGVKMDKEGWFSVTPERIARHHASRCGSGTVIDCFTGVGGNAIQFAKSYTARNAQVLKMVLDATTIRRIDGFVFISSSYCRSNHVIGIDIDPQKIDYAQHNAVIYGVDDRIDFIKGDFFHLAPMLRGDVVFMSPPWGGPDYTKSQIYDITMLKPHDGFFLFKIGRMIASRIVMFLPRNVDLNQLAELALSVNPPWTVEVEKNFLNGKLKAITAYFNILAPQEAHHFAYGSP